jgi:hypothetical protein
MRESNGSAAMNELSEIIMERLSDRAISLAGLYDTLAPDVREEIDRWLWFLIVEREAKASELADKVREGEMESLERRLRFWIINATN